MGKQGVSFYSCGLKLAAHLCIPDDAQGDSPTVPPAASTTHRLPAERRCCGAVGLAESKSLTSSGKLPAGVSPWSGQGAKFGNICTKAEQSGMNFITLAFDN